MRFSLATAVVAVSLCTGLGPACRTPHSRRAIRASIASNADAISRCSAIAPAVTPRRAASRSPAASRCRRRSERSSRPNITPDRDTGIGNWTDDEFVAALHDGRGHNGTRLYPAMPYPAYTKMTDDDVLAMRAYFATVAPVHNKVIANQLPFPLNIRFAMVFWNWLNFTPGRYQPNPQKSAEWNRGAYIVEGPGHCGTCHTPKTVLGGDKTGTPLAGATLQGWFAPNITTNSHKGIGGWSKDDLVQYLKTGTNNWTLASGPMAEAVTHSTSQMTDEDIAAIATYLKDSGAGDSASKPAPVAANDNAMRAGAAIYKDSCAVCHRDSGEGESHLFPRLAGSALVQSDDPTTLAHVVLQGTRAVATSDQADRACDAGV